MGHPVDSSRRGDVILSEIPNYGWLTEFSQRWHHHSVILRSVRFHVNLLKVIRVLVEILTEKGKSHTVCIK